MRNWENRDSWSIQNSSSSGSARGGGKWSRIGKSSSIWPNPSAVMTSLTFVSWFHNNSEIEVIFLYLQMKKLEMNESTLATMRVAQSSPTLLWPHGMQPVRLLCLWNSPGKNTGVGSHSLLQGLFLARGSNLGLLHCRWILYHLSHQGSPATIRVRIKSWVFLNHTE